MNEKDFDVQQILMKVSRRELISCPHRASNSAFSAGKQFKNWELPVKARKKSSTVQKISKHKLIRCLQGRRDWSTTFWRGYWLLESIQEGDERKTFRITILRSCFHPYLQEINTQWGHLWLISIIYLDDWLGYHFKIINWLENLQ